MSLEDATCLEDATLGEDDVLATQNPLAWLLEASALASDALADRTRGRVLEVAQLFGSDVVAMRHFGRDRAVRVGRGDFEAPLELLPAEDHPLLSHDGESWVAVLDPAWEAFVEVGSARRSVAELHAEGLARLFPDGLLRVRIPDEGRLAVQIGGTAFLAQPVYLCRPGPLLPPLSIDRSVAGAAGAMALFAVIAGVLMATVPPPPQLSRMEKESRLVELWKETPPPPPPVAQVVKRPAEGGGAKGEEGASVKDPGAKDPLKRKELDKDIATAAGVVGAIANDAALDALLGETGLPSDLQQAVGSMIGVRATQNGIGLGRRGPGIGGGGTADAVGGLGPRGRGPGSGGFASGGEFGKKVAGDFADIGGTPIILGSLDKAEIDRVIKGHLAAIRHCYQRELQRRPDMSGKLSVRFVIAKDGSVSQATTRSSSLESPAVESCVNERILRLGFPAPRGGGIVIVTYPFVFASA